MCRVAGAGFVLRGDPEMWRCRREKAALPPARLRDKWKPSWQWALEEGRERDLIIFNKAPNQFMFPCQFIPRTPMPHISVSVFILFLLIITYPVSLLSKRRLLFFYLLRSPELKPLFSPARRRPAASGLFFLQCLGITRL